MRTTHSTGRHCTTATCPLATFTIRDSREYSRDGRPAKAHQARPHRLPSADRHAPPRNIREGECPVCCGTPQGCPVCRGRRSEACPFSFCSRRLAGVCVWEGEAEVRDFGVWACLLNDLGGVKEVDGVVIVLLHPLCANTCHAPACTYTRKP
jgi:hypothetical protein